MLQLEILVGVGQAMCDRSGELIPSYQVDAEFKNQIEKVKEEYPELVDSTTNAGRSFVIFGTSRRGSQTIATESGMDDRAIEKNL